MRKELTFYKEYPSAIICKIPEGKAKLIADSIEHIESKITILTPGFIITYLTYAERKALDNCPTCQILCPITKLEGTIDHEYEAYFKRYKDLCAELFMDDSLDYLCSIFPFDRQVLKHLLISSNGDVNRIIKTINISLSTEKPLLDCFNYTKPIKIQADVKVSIGAMKENNYKDIIKASLLEKLISNFLDSDITPDVTYSNQHDHNVLLARLELIISNP